MGRYMTVVLKEEHRSDVFIQLLNEDLLTRFGANNCLKFNSWDFLQEEADYFNNHTEGRKMLQGWERPITKETLSGNFFWYRNGEFTFKLSGGGTADEARDVIAVCKWLIATKCKYIDKSTSDNYSKEVVSQYLDYLFEEEGYNMEALWELPNN